ncbi:hypothetical protein RFI_24522 [Reticulomyxa filosa]|uniref:Uncharacterized protein n=1 Tax=Reticulomyxa filosa TaxID=46433 RepID=X6MFR7_RETFI|nr:hypothetical protein RFI_24522 [Reticulomyxa filosa]|eukprot:ETO12853.1 hypothetical protein RFI_24522 [Reticulomyxa filosa]
MSIINDPTAKLEEKYLSAEFFATIFKKQLRSKLKDFVPSGHPVDENLVDVSDQSFFFFPFSFFKNKNESMKKMRTPPKKKKKVVTLIVGSGREKKELVSDLEEFFGRRKSINFVEWVWETLNPIIQSYKDKQRKHSDKANKFPTKDEKGEEEEEEEAEEEEQETEDDNNNNEGNNKNETEKETTKSYNNNNNNNANNNNTNNNNTNTTNTTTTTTNNNNNNNNNNNKTINKNDHVNDNSDDKKKNSNTQTKLGHDETRPDVIVIKEAHPSFSNSGHFPKSCVIAYY